MLYSHCMLGAGLGRAHLWLPLICSKTCQLLCFFFLHPSHQVTGNKSLGLVLSRPSNITCFIFLSGSLDLFKWLHKNTAMSFPGSLGSGSSSAWPAIRSRVTSHDWNEIKPWQNPSGGWLLCAPSLLPSCSLEQQQPRASSYDPHKERAFRQRIRVVVTTNKHTCPLFCRLEEILYLLVISVGVCSRC